MASVLNTIQVPPTDKHGLQTLVIHSEGYILASGHTVQVARCAAMVSAKTPVNHAHPAADKWAGTFVPIDNINRLRLDATHISTRC